MTGELLIYGSYGYTGELVTERAIEEGLTPTLAGRNTEKVERQASEHGLDHRVFGLEHPEIVAETVAGFDAVLHCAGPFSATAGPMVAACLDGGTDYLDITGEIDVLEAIAERDREAERADVTLLPAVGFDVVPTDCLAAHLHNRVPSATHLRLAIDGLGTYSPGTLKSIVEGLSRPGAVREEGAIRTVPPAWRTRRIDLGTGEKFAVTVPWGDVSTAYYATGIPNAEVYATVPERAVSVMRRTRVFTPLLATNPVQWALKRLVDVTVSGPSADERAGSSTRIWGEVESDAGIRVARLRTPDPYDVTAMTAVESARRVLDGDVGPGFQTPASAFGPDFVLDFEGVEREEEDPRTSGQVDVSEGLED